MGGHGHAKIHISEKLPEALKANMKLFQAVNDIPVHLKGGPMDRVLVGTTFVACAVGLLGVANLIYKLGWAKK